MSNSLRALKRQKDKDLGELPPAEQKLPTGRVLSEPLKGTFLSFPLLGWIALRNDASRTPLVMLVLALVEFNESSERIRGTLEMELPLYVDTEMATIAALDRYGWTGTAWAAGDPPPYEDANLAEQLTGLLAQTTPALKATLLFAQDPETGNALAQSVEVTRAKGRFLMPPLEPAGVVAPEKVEALRALVRSYLTFYPTAEG